MNQHQRGRSWKLRRVRRRQRARSWRRVTGGVGARDGGGASRRRGRWRWRGRRRRGSSPSGRSGVLLSSFGGIGLLTRSCSAVTRLVKKYINQNLVIAVNARA